MEQKERMKEAVDLASELLEKKNEGSFDDGEYSEMISKFVEILPIVAYLGLLMEFNSPSKEMNVQSAVFGFIMGLQSTMFFPEWARAFYNRYQSETENPRSEEENARVMFDRFVRLTPLSEKQEMPNAN